MGCATSAVGVSVAETPTGSNPVLLTSPQSNAQSKIRPQDAKQALLSTPPPQLQLYNEHQALLKQAGAEYHDRQTSFTSKDVLVVVDMQNDFLPAEDAPDGGRLAVQEGATAADVIVDLIDKAARAGAAIIATRDYHPKDHSSFHHTDGPLPSHCVQGTTGSLIFPPVAQALSNAELGSHNADVRVVFKGFKRSGTLAASSDMCGCCALDWTQASCLTCTSTSQVLNAHPDVGADGFARKTLSEELKELGAKRLFVVGLAMDICVLDTAVNAALLNIPSCDIFMPLDASRAVHAPHLYASGRHSCVFGTGFVSDPRDIVSKAKKAGVKLCHATCIQ